MLITTVRTTDNKGTKLYIEPTFEHVINDDNAVVIAMLGDVRIAQTQKAVAIRDGKYLVIVLIDGHSPCKVHFPTNGGKCRTMTIDDSDPTFESDKEENSWCIVEMDGKHTIVWKMSNKICSQQIDTQMAILLLG